METKTIMEPDELEEDRIYSFDDLRIKATTDYDFNPVVYTLIPQHILLEINLKY